MLKYESLILSFAVGLVLLSLQSRNVFGIQMKNLEMEQCLNSNNIVHVEELALSTNGSRWFVKGKLSVDATLEAPLRAQIKMERRVFYQWIRIPCISDFGSCRYSDICSIMDDYDLCREDVSEQSIPCKCPIFKGKYAIKMETDHTFISKFEVALKGHYRASLEMFKEDELIACYNLKFKITK